jgi:hypothetical protein
VVHAVVMLVGMVDVKVDTVWTCETERILAPALAGSRRMRSACLAMKATRDALDQHS